MINRFIKAICFTATLIIILFFLTELFTPTWTSWNNDNTMKEFYKEPKNSIQVLFLGTSQVASGISPVNLYDQYGICAYNLGTERQPLLSSYYWLQEVERLHSDSLKVVVLDISYLYFLEKKNDNFKYMNEKALAHMAISPVKINALRDLSSRYSNFDYIENLIPLLRYHSRWDSLTIEDFKGFTGESNILYTRGQEILYKQACSFKKAYEIQLPHWDLTDDYEALETDENAFIKKVGKDNLMLINNIYDFCKDHNLNLVFTKLPKYWTDDHHDAAVYLANQLDVPFIDYNDIDMVDELSLSFLFDYMDAAHPNIRGAQKFSDFIGRYIKEHYEIEDVRNNPFYDFMKEQSEQYKLFSEDSLITPIRDLSSYLENINKDRYTVFVTVAEDAASGMTDQIKKQMADLGFKEFPSLRYEQAYIAIRTNGEVILEEKSSSKSGRLLSDGIININEFYISNVYNETLDADGYVIGTEDGKDPGLLSGPEYFSIRSDSKSAGGTTSVIINNVEHSDNKHGLNFVVYDNITRMVIDSATFDLRYNIERRSDLDPIDEYNERYEKVREKGEAFRQKYAEAKAA